MAITVLDELHDFLALLEGSFVVVAGNPRMKWLERVSWKWKRVTHRDEAVEVGKWVL
jgi:hypothetical protein